MNLKSVFVNRHAELRLGWRIIVFLLLFAGCAVVLFLPLAAFGFASVLAQAAVALVALLAASYVMTRAVNRKPFTAIGLSRHPRMLSELATGGVLGVLLMATIFLVGVAAGSFSVSWVAEDALAAIGTLCWAALSFGLAAAVEEVLFRGYLFQTLIQWITFVPATLLMSLTFAAAHLLNPHVSPLALVNIVLAGIMLSVAYMKTRSLWLPLSLHISWNFSQTTLFGLVTSGQNFPDLRLVSTVETGPAWLTGGTFGPEGGVPVTVMVLAGTWYILKSSRLNVPEGRVTLDSVEDIVPRQVQPGDAL